MLFSVYIIFIFLISTYHCRLPDKVFCANEECNGPISKAKTLINYNSPDPDFISFRGNTDAIVLMKSAGTNPDIWYASINGKSGFINSRFLREYKIVEKNPQAILLVDAIKEKAEVKPDRVQKAHEVFEGTTIFTTEPSTSVNNQDTLNEVVKSQSSNLDQSNESSKKLNDDSKALPIIGNIEHFLNQDGPLLTTEPVIESEKTLLSEKVSTENIQSTNVENDTNLPQNLFDASQTNSQNTLSYETNVNEPMTSVEKENISIEAKKKPENIDLVDQTISKTGSNDVKDQPLVLAKSDNNLNILPTEPPVVDSGSTVPQTDFVSQNDNSNKVSSINGVNPHDQANNVVQENSNFTPPPDVKQSDSSTIPSEVKINEQSVNTPDAVVTTTPSSNIPNQGLPQKVVIPVTEAHPTVSEYPQAPPPVSPQFNTLPPIVDNVVIDNIPPTIPAILAQTDTVPSIITPAPIPESIPSQTESTVISDYSQVTESIAAETPPPLPEILLSESVTSVPNYGSPVTEFSPTTENIPSAEITEHSSIMNDALEVTSDTTIAVPEQLPQSYDSQSTESLISEIFAESTTEAPKVEENSEGFLSNLYTTIVDMMPPSTEAPEPDVIFNPDYVQKSESESDETESFSFISYIWSTYTSVMGAKEESSALFPVAGETCFTDEYCDGTSSNQNRLLTFLLTTASTVLLFTLGYYYIDNKRQDSRVIGNINNLQRELLFATKECEILKEELATTKTKLTGIEDNSFGMDDMVQSLKEEINDLKEQNERLRNSLDDNEKLLRVSENTASELQNTLGEVENTLSELLSERTNSEDQIAELNDKNRAFEEELISVSRDRDNFQLKYVSAENALEDYNKQKQMLEELNKKISEANNTMELQKYEIVALKDAIKELKSGAPLNADANSLIDHTEIKAKLAKALEEKNSYMKKYEVAHKEQTRLAEEMKATQESYQNSSQQATEAITRLEVLGKYFKERESELMKELSTKESLWLSKQGESASTVEKIELLQKEVQRYKEKCDALTLELAEQESSRRAAVSELESRAHAAWLEARQARRDADAASADAAALRRKLVAVSHADGAISPHRQVASPLDVDGALVPPLPLAFFPPPLLPPLHRPPPLGRLPSPPLPPRYGERRFSPERRYSPESRYSPETRYSPESRYSPDTGRYSPDSRYSPRMRRSPYSSRPRRRSIERYSETRARRSGPEDTEYNSDSPTRRPRRRYSRRSGSSGSGSTESEK